ncbi:MAG: NADH-quinone oxidoreductase subunit M [Actinomycetota bacterium]|nr:NADH-quinone oxidoreductase subunit M [Actinomycetota bacterium]
MSSLPLLTLLVAVPFLGAGVVAALPANNRNAIRTTALGATGLTFALSLVVLARFRPVAGFQLQESAAWVPQWGITYRLGVDGVSLLLVVLTTLILPLTVLAAWEHQDRVKGFFASLLALEATLLGVFLALDLVLFYAFFEALLVPMYALIGIWGGVRRRYAAVKFFLFTLVGGLLMLVGILALYFSGGAQSFGYEDLLSVPLTGTQQTLLFLCFFAAFAIKVPLFPLHTWLPDAHTEAPTVGSVILAAVTLKIGGYGFLRYSLPFFPEASTRLAPVMLALGVIGVLYGALIAMVQRDVKRLVAYSSMAHLGFVVIGVFALHPTGAAGAVVHMVNHGITTGALFLLIGFLYDRTHSREIAEHSGLLKAAPVFGGLFLVTAMSSLALPGLNGFVGEFPILLGTYQTVPWAAVAAAFGVILAALYLLWAYQRMFHGPVEGHAVGVTDLNAREIAVVVPLVVLMLGIGLYPKPLYDRVNPSVESIVAGVRDRATAATDQRSVSQEAP